MPDCSFLTAMAVLSGSWPLNTDPKAPPLSLLEKFQVKDCRSWYLNTVAPWWLWTLPLHIVSITYVFRAFNSL
jgi:hypothetical protein